MSLESKGLNPNHNYSFKAELFQAFKYLKNFCVRPVESIRSAPQWHWQTLLATAFIVAAAFGALGGIVKLKPTLVIAGAIVFPFGTLIVVGTLSAFVYYSSIFLFHSNLEIKKVATISFLACLPWIAVGPLVDYIPPLKPVAVLMSGFLAIVGFTENTNLSKRNVTRMIGTIVSVFVVFWVINMIRNFESSPDKEKLIDQQTLDILQEEMQKIDEKTE